MSESIRNRDQDSVQVDPNPHKVLNRYCKQIFKEMLQVYPDSKILKLVKVSFSLLKKVNKKAITNFFYKNVIVHHRQDVENRVPFFLNPNFSVTGFDCIGKNINETWDISNEAMRAKYWEYMIKLTELTLLAKCPDETC